MNKAIEKIVIDPKICSGKPCIKGTRIPVHIILDLFLLEKILKESRRHIPTLLVKILGRVVTMLQSLLRKKPGLQREDFCE